MQISPASAERRYAAQTKHDTLLESRTETLSLYTQLAALRPFKPDQGVQLILQEFCEALVDYTASAHFQLYRFIDEGTERRQNVLEISESTHTIDLKLEISLKWYDNRVLFYNLKSEDALNVLSNSEV